MSHSPTQFVSGSDRVRLAAQAVDGATRVDGVTAADAGPRGLHVTNSGSTVVVGALVVAEPGGRYSIDLGLCAQLVPLEALADRVREGVARSAVGAGLGDRVGAISVTFHDLAAPAAVAGG